MAASLFECISVNSLANETISFTASLAADTIAEPPIVARLDSGIYPGPCVSRNNSSRFAMSCSTDFLFVNVTAWLFTKKLRVFV